MHRGGFRTRQLLLGQIGRKPTDFAFACPHTEDVFFTAVHIETVPNQIEIPGGSRRDLRGTLCKLHIGSS